MSDDKPEALLRSALEKIVYFEARSNQLANDADHLRAEVERLKGDLGAASQREIELRRVIAELEVRATRAHSEREEVARVADALRRERAELIGKMLEASRIHGNAQLDDFDLAQFIAQLRSEVLVQRDGAPVLVSRVSDVSAPAPMPVVPPAPKARAETAPLVKDQPEPAALRSYREDETRPSNTFGTSELSALTGSVTAVAVELRAQGRIGVTAGDLARLSGALEFPGRSEETLFGFSVRELSAPDAGARVRAAERLEALRHPAAAPALATALHGEAEPSVQVALLSALASLAQGEAVPVVTPHLTSAAPDVRIAALKALLSLDPSAAGPHLAAAAKDPDKAVRRRASLLALGLTGAEAFELGQQAIRDSDADVRSLAALVLGASNAETSRPLLMDAMCDRDVRVRRAAAQSLSRLLGTDVTNLVNLDDAQRRREVRRLALLPVKAVPPLTARAKVTAALAQVTPVAARVSVGAQAPVAPMPVTAMASAASAASASTQAAPAVGPARQAVAVASQAAALPAPVASAPAQAAAPMRSAAAQAGTVSSNAQAAAAHVTSPASATALSATQAPVAAPRAPVGATAAPAPFGVKSAVQTLAAEPQRSRVAVLEVDAAPAAPSASLTSAVLRELRAAIRGRPLNELADGIGASMDETMRACGALMAEGHVVRRGHKYFVA